MNEIKIYLNLNNFNFDPVADKEILEVAGYARMARSEDCNLQIITFQNNPMAFLQDQVVDQLLADEGDDALPITVNDNQAIISGRYPTREELEELLGITLLPVSVKREALMQKALAEMNNNQSCCGGSCDSCSGCF